MTPNWTTVKLIDDPRLVRDQVNAHVSNCGRRLYLREGLRKKLGSHCIVVYDAGSGAYAIRGCSADEPEARAVNNKHTIPARKVIDAMRLEPGDVVNVHESDGVFILLRPGLRDKDIHAAEPEEDAEPSGNANGTERRGPGRPRKAAGLC